MPRINPDSVQGGVQTCAFLDMIAVSEGTSTSPITKDDGYDIIVSSIDATGRLVRNRFDDYSDHPFANGRKSLVVNSKGLTSNASGRGQIMLRDWPHYKALLKLPDFSPVSQDKYLVQLLKEQGAIQPLIDGDLQTAVYRCRNIWASLPGNNYGQAQQRFDTLRAAFILNGGNCK
jgi:muramidase (phage lysozyme)